MTEIVIVDHDQVRLMDLTVALRSLRTGITAVQASTSSTALDARDLARTAPLAMLVALGATDTVVDIRDLLSSAARNGTMVVLLAPSHPPHAALVRIAGEFAAPVLPGDEAPVVVAATVVSMLHQRQGVS